MHWPCFFKSACNPSSPVWTETVSVLVTSDIIAMNTLTLSLHHAADKIVIFTSYVDLSSLETVVPWNKHWPSCWRDSFYVEQQLCQAIISPCICLIFTYLRIRLISQCSTCSFFAHSASPACYRGNRNHRMPPSTGHILESVSVVPVMRGQQ